MSFFSRRLRQWRQLRKRRSGIGRELEREFCRAPLVVVARPRRAARSRVAPLLPGSCSRAWGWSCQPGGAGGIGRELTRECWTCPRDVVVVVPGAPLAHGLLLLSRQLFQGFGRRDGVLDPAGQAGSGGSSNVSVGRARALSSSPVPVAPLAHGCSSSPGQLFQGVGMELSTRRGGRDRAGAHT